MDKIIGRDTELAKLAKYNQSGKAEFIAYSIIAKDPSVLRGV